MFRAIISVIVFFLASVLAAYASHAAPGSPTGPTMPEFIWGSISFVCLLAGIITPIALVADEVDNRK